MGKDLSTKILLETDTSALWVVENYIPKEYQEEFLDSVQGLYLQKNPPVVVYGKKCNQKRAVGFFSKVAAEYKYSGQAMEARPLTSDLKRILPAVNNSLGTDFNGILVNRYEDGEDYIGAHSDDETGLSGGKVASISFGATRTFRIRDKKTKKVILDYEVPAYSLLVMDGDFQKEFTHEMPVRKKVKDTRWSLTFRSHN